MDAVKPEGDVERGGRAEQVVPSGAAGVGLGIGVRILAGHQLESIDLLIGEGVAEKQAVARAQVLIQADGGGVGIDGLGRVDIERPGIDIRAVGRERGIRIEPVLDQFVNIGVGCERRAFTRKRNQDIAIHVDSGASGWSR